MRNEGWDGMLGGERAGERGYKGTDEGVAMEISKHLQFYLMNPKDHRTESTDCNRRNLPRLPFLVLLKPRMIIEQSTSTRSRR